MEKPLEEDAGVVEAAETEVKDYAYHFIDTAAKASALFLWEVLAD